MYLFSIVASGDWSNSAGVMYNLAQYPIARYLSFTIVFIHLLTGAIVLVDFLCFGFLKRIKNKYFSQLYLGVFKYFSVITASFLFRPLYLNFIDDQYTKRFLLLSIPYFFILLLVSGSEFRTLAFVPEFPRGYREYIKKSHLLSEVFFPSHYDEEIERYQGLNERESRIHFVSIPAKKLTGQLAQFFYKIPASIDNLIRIQEPSVIELYRTGLLHGFKSADIEDVERIKADDIFRLELEEKQKTLYLQSRKLSSDEIDKLWYSQKRRLVKRHIDSLSNAKRQDLIKVKKVVQSSVFLKVDSLEILNNHLDCDFYQHPLTRDMGLLCYFQLNDLETGRHHLNFSFIDSELRKDVLLLDTIDVSIPFIYEKFE